MFVYVLLVKQNRHFAEQIICQMLHEIAQKKLVVFRTKKDKTALFHLEKVAGLYLETEKTFFSL